MQITNHVLAKEGILTNFSIAKKVSAKDIKKLRDKITSTKKDAETVQNLLKTALIKETRKNLSEHKIPGLIMDGIEDVEEKKRIAELTYFASMIAKKLAEKKIDKYHSCYIINAIVNMLDLTEENFEEFHKKFAKFKNGENEPTKPNKPIEPNESDGYDDDDGPGLI